MNYGAGGRVFDVLCGTHVLALWEPCTRVVQTVCSVRVRTECLHGGQGRVLRGRAQVLTGFEGRVRLSLRR